MNLRLTLLLLASFSLISCVASYQLPPGYSGPLATINNSGNTLSPFKAEVFNIYKINGLYSRAQSPMSTPYGGGPIVTLRQSTTQVPAQRIQIEIVGRDAYAADGVAILDKMAGGERKPVSGTVEFTPKAGGVYVVKGLLGKQSSSVWIEDARTGKPVTNKVVK